MKRILHDELPDDNYFILKYVVNFMTEVEQHSDQNKMTAQNLAIVFGPNLMWSKSQVFNIIPKEFIWQAACFCS